MSKMSNYYKHLKERQNIFKTIPGVENVNINIEKKIKSIYLKAVELKFLFFFGSFKK